MFTSEDDLKRSKEEEESGVESEDEIGTNVDLVQESHEFFLKGISNFEIGTEDLIDGKGASTPSDILALFFRGLLDPKFESVCLLELDGIQQEMLGAENFKTICHWSFQSIEEQSKILHLVFDTYHQPAMLYDDSVPVPASVSSVMSFFSKKKIKEPKESKHFEPRSSFSETVKIMERLKSNPNGQSHRFILPVTEKGSSLSGSSHWVVVAVDMIFDETLSQYYTEACFFNPLTELGTLTSAGAKTSSRSEIETYLIEKEILAKKGDLKGGRYSHQSVHTSACGRFAFAVSRFLITNWNCPLETIFNNLKEEGHNIAKGLVLSSKDSLLSKEMLNTIEKVARKEYSEESIPKVSEFIQPFPQIFMELDQALLETDQVEIDQEASDQAIAFVQRELKQVLICLRSLFAKELQKQVPNYELLTEQIEKNIEDQRELIANESSVSDGDQKWAYQILTSIKDDLLENVRARELAVEGFEYILSGRPG